MLSSFSDSVNCDYSGSSSCGNDISGHLWTAVLVWAASAGVGLGIGIPGIISMARQSEVETNAVDRYQYPHGMLPPQPYYPAQPAYPAPMPYQPVAGVIEPAPIAPVAPAPAVQAPDTTTAASSSLQAD